MSPCRATSYSSKPRCAGPTAKAWNRSPGGRRRRRGTSTSIRKQPPGSRCAATFWKHATCSSCVVRFMIVFATRYASANVPSTVAVAKSPIVTPIASALGFARSRATIASDRSIPWTETPRAASGSARRPVPMPSSSAAPSPASSPSRSTIGPTTVESAWYAYRSSKWAATLSPKWSSGTDAPRLRVDVERAAADEAAERDPAIGGELDCEGGRRSHRDEHRAAYDRRLLDELEREAAADAENRTGQRQQPVEERPAHDLVERVVAPHVLANAEQVASRGEEPARVQPARGLERRLRRTEPVRQRRHENRRDAQVALDPRRLHGHGLERALPADAAGGRGVEAALQRAEVGVRRLDLDRVRSQVVRDAGRQRA